MKRRLRRGAKAPAMRSSARWRSALLKALRLHRSRPHGEFRRLAHAHDRPLAAGKQASAASNLSAAFPEKSAAEIDAILRGVWDNLGRMGAEFAQLDRLWDYDPAHPERRSRIELASKRRSSAFTAPRQRRQAGADLRRPSRQLGTAGDRRGDIRARQRRALPHARTSRAIDRWLRRDARGQHGRAHPHRPRGADEDRRGAASAAPMSACWSINITCAASR